MPAPYEPNVTTKAGIFGRPTGGATSHAKPDPLLADAVADGSHALAIEDRGTEIRQAIERKLDNLVVAYYGDAIDAGVEVALERDRVAAAREAALRAGVTALREDAETAHAALDRITAVLGEDPEQVTGASVPSLVEDTLGRASAELADLKARIDAVRAAVADYDYAAPDSPVHPLWRAVRSALAGDTTEDDPYADSDDPTGDRWADDVAAADRESA